MMSNEIFEVLVRRKLIQLDEARQRERQQLILLLAEVLEIDSVDRIHALIRMMIDKLKWEDGRAN